MWTHTTTTLPSISRLPNTPRDAAPGNWNLGRRRQVHSTDSSRRVEHQHWRNPDMSTSQDPDMMRMAYERTAYSFFERMRGEFMKETNAYAMQMMTLQDQVLTLKRQIAEMHGHITTSLRDVASDEIRTISPAGPTQLSPSHDQNIASQESDQTQPLGLEDQLIPMRPQANDQEESPIFNMQDRMPELERQIQALQDHNPSKQGLTTALQDDIESVCASEVAKALDSFLHGQQLRQHVKRAL
eukprot:CAMPEP_0179222052 /NCGR_PEP_ID=MMETSP0797-20121207/6518_1 /TAXON_ID=47934 /ORGANISM="Dinophysis acuminata, Strain DAEP01" /LENGTH=241 /DNA_ID=CAMNT_0020928875 /DNA_START=65 /DNA_END=786 /DNA_ORIENTATION=+